MDLGFTPGFRFANGRLYVFTEERVTVLRSWPELEGVTKQRGESAWQPHWPSSKVVLPYRRTKLPKPKKNPAGQLALDLEFDEPEALDPRSRLALQRKRAFDGLRFSLPKEVARAVEPFPYEHWALLHLFRDQMGALDLVKTNPALTFALASALYPDHLEKARHHQLASLRQRDLTERLGFPAGEATVKLLKKIPPEATSSNRLSHLKALLRVQDVVKVLSHLETINSGVIEAVMDPQVRALCAPRLLAEIAGDRREKYRGVASETIRQCLAMAEALDRPLLSIVSSLKQLERMHEELALAYSRLQLTESENVVLPPPPVPGLPNKIVPLRSTRELIEEGQVQRNCVATYAQLVQSGRTFIYRILFPQRATLAIDRTQGRKWEVGELKLAENRDPSRVTEQFVQAWLDYHMAMR